MTDICPFIGVRGWANPGEAEGIPRMFDSLGHEPTRKFAVIVNVDDMTLIEGEHRARERCGVNNAHARLRPPVDDVVGYAGHPGIYDGRSGIFVNHPLVLNFVFLDTHEMLLWNRMDEFVERYGSLLHGIELGKAWPPVWVGDFRERHPELRMMLRVTRDAVREVGSVGDGATPFLVAARVAQYIGITDVLVNLSGPPEEGGVLFDTELVRQYLRAIRAAAPGVGLCVAGGFGVKPRTLVPLESLLPEFPDLSSIAGAALTSVANCIDTGSAVGLYLNAEPISAKNMEAAASEAEFRAKAEQYKHTQDSYS